MMDKGHRKVAGFHDMDIQVVEGFVAEEVEWGETGSYCAEEVEAKVVMVLV